MKSVATEESSVLTHVSHCFSAGHRTALGLRHRETFLSHCSHPDHTGTNSHLAHAAF